MEILQMFALIIAMNFMILMAVFAVIALLKGGKADEVIDDIFAENEPAIDNVDPIVSNTIEHRRQQCEVCGVWFTRSDNYVGKNKKCYQCRGVKK